LFSAVYVFSAMYNVSKGTTDTSAPRLAGVNRIRGCGIAALSVLAFELTPRIGLIIVFEVTNQLQESLLVRNEW
jgi:hypothetical protein